MDSNDALVLVISRNSFYRRMHFLAIAAFALSLVAIGFLTWALIFLVRNPTNPLYFATDNVGRLIEIIPVDRPNMSIEDVTQWTVDAVQNAYSYDYVNYHSQLQNSQKYFTTYGWTNYMTALQASNNLLALTERKLIIIGAMAGPAKLVTQGILGGAYAYKFQMPLLVTFWKPPYDDKSKVYNPLQVTVIVQRQPILQSYKGLGIVQIIGELMTQTNTQPQEISGTSTG